LNTFVEVLRFINLLLAGIVAGGQVLVLLTTTRVIRGLTPALAIQMHQAILDDHADKHMPPAAFIATLSALIILIVHYHLSHTSGIFTALGILCTVGVIGVSLSLVRRSNEQIHGWSEGTATEGALQARQAWDRAQTFRTALGVAALASYIIGALA
jgi:hypothetical protein